MHLSDEEFEKNYTSLKLNNEITSINNKNHYFKNRFNVATKKTGKLLESID